MFSDLTTRRSPVWLIPVGVATAFIVWLLVSSSVSLFYPLRGADQYAHYATVYRFFECGNTTFNHFGFPNGMGLAYFPSSDWALSVPANIVSCVFDNQFIGINLVWALSFPATAFVASWALTQVGVNRNINILFSIAIALLPYHWMRLYHMFLATIFSMILGIGLVFYVKKKAQILAFSEVKVDSFRIIRTALPVVLISVLIAGSGLYYSVFTLVLIVVSMFYAFGESYRRNHFALAIASIGSILTTLAASYLVTFLYIRKYPLDFNPTQRNPSESFLYSINLDRIIPLSPRSGLPLPDAFREKLIQIETITNSFNIPTFEEGGWFSNIIIFVCWLLLPFILSKYGRILKRPNFQTENPYVKSDTNLAITLMVTSLLISIPWGINFLFAVFITPQIRAWGRFEPAIQFLLLIVVAIILSASIKPFASQKWLPVVTALSVMALLIDVATPAREFVRNSANPLRVIAESSKSYGMDVNSVETRRCGILQLPYVGYPEAGDKYHFEVAFQNADKDWSFGQFRAAPDSKLIEAIGNEIDTQEEASLIKLGFCGVHVDLRGVAPEVQQPFLQGFVSQYGEPDAKGLDGNWNFWTFELQGDQ